MHDPTEPIPRIPRDPLDRLRRLESLVESIYHLSCRRVSLSDSMIVDAIRDHIEEHRDDMRAGR